MGRKKLGNKTAVVTGATSGIGMALSVILARKGMKLFLVGRSFDKLQDQLKNVGPDSDITYIKLDLLNENAIEEKLLLINRGLPIDFLIHCAGVISFDLFEMDKIQNLDIQFKVNVRSAYQITHFFLPALKASQGTVLFLNSTAGLDAWENLSQYASTKHALRAMATSLRKEMMAHKVKVSSVFCGSTDTPMQQKVQRARNLAYDSNKFIDPKHIAKIIVSILTLPDEVTIPEVTILGNK